MSAIDRQRLNTLLGASALAGVLPRASVAQQKPIRIRLPLSSTGGFAAADKSALMAGGIWRRKANEAGGLLGRPVEFITYGDQSSPSTGALRAGP